MSEHKTAQLDFENPPPQMPDDNDPSSPPTVQKTKVDLEDSGTKIESPTPEKLESRSKGIVVSSLAGNLLAERYKDRFANQLGEDEDDTDDEDYNDDSVSPGSSRSLISGSIELHEKHKDLLNLFNRMESSIRLLCLRKKMTTFNNIAAQVEVLTKRKLSYNHLAQMKYLFPEAIQIKSIRLHDEKSLCMYADMEITLIMDVVECTSPDQSPSMTICEAFYSKLLQFLDAHHKGTDIPEAILPEPFNSRSREKLFLEASQNEHAAEPPLQRDTEDGFSNASHFPQSFQKLMSQKIVADGTEKTRLLSDPAELSSVIACDTERTNISPKKPDKHASVPRSSEISATPSRNLISCCQESTPKQGTSKSPLLGTPAMQTPKRPLPTPLEKLEATCGHVSEPRSAISARRSLNTSLNFEGGSSSCDDGIEHAATAKKDIFSEDSSSFNESLEENVPGLFTDKGKINQVDPVDTQEKIASLRTTFDIVCDISHSTKNSLITKQELFHNILANNLDIEAPGEIEEQLHILEDLAPHWISKVVNGEEIIYSIEPITDQNSVRARLVEAI